MSQDLIQAIIQISLIIAVVIIQHLYFKCRNKQKNKIPLQYQKFTSSDREHLKEWADENARRQDENKKLLEIYQLGVDHELNGIEGRGHNNHLEARAYTLGRIDAITGDGIHTFDEKTDETILHQIYNSNIC